MAKSRKSKKTTDPADESVETKESAGVEAKTSEDLEPTKADPDESEVAQAAEDQTSEPEEAPAVEADDDSEMSYEAALAETDAEMFEEADGSTAAEDTEMSYESALAETDAEVFDGADDAEMSYENALAETDAELFDEAVADAETADADVEVVSDKPEPASVAAAVPASAPQSSSGGMWPALFGGVIAALIGFIVGRGDALDQYLPESLQRPAFDSSALEAEAASLAELTAAQEERIAALEAAPAPTAAPEATDPNPELVEALTAAQATIASLSERIDVLESAPAVPENTVSSDEVATLQQALEAQNEQIAALAERAEKAEKAAAGEAARILARAALTRVVTAVDSGQSFAPALGDLEEVTPVEVPDALRTAADTGVPTIASLQDSFPEAARVALAAARSDVPESEVQSVTGFLKRQLQARSVVPREGDDPDAVLSRAQAAMRAGDLDTALTELSSLSETALAAMSDWVESAQARKAAQDAANALADSLNSN